MVPPPMFRFPAAPDFVDLLTILKLILGRLLGTLLFIKISFMFLLLAIGFIFYFNYFFFVITGLLHIDPDRYELI